MTSSRLTALLNELGDCLQAASDSGTSPQGSELQLHARIRTVLVSLFAECIDTKTVKDRDLISLLNLINMALEKFRRIVRDDNGATVFTIIGQTIHLLAEERLMNTHSYLLQTLLLLAGSLSSVNMQAYASMCSGGGDLVSDLCGLLRHMSTPGPFAPGATAKVHCFVSVQIAQQPSRQGPGAITVQLSSVLQCKTFLANALELLASLMQETPATCAAFMPTSASDDTVDLIAHGGFTVQTAAFQVALQLLSGPTPSRIPFHGLMDASITALQSWVDYDGAFMDHPLYVKWSQRLLAVLHVLWKASWPQDAQKMAGMKLIKVLPDVISACGKDPAFRLQLCQLLVDCAKAQPDGCAAFHPVLPLLKETSSAARCLAGGLRRMLAGSKAQTSPDGNQPQGVPQGNGGEEPAAKRRRVDPAGGAARPLSQQPNQPLQQASALVEQQSTQERAHLVKELVAMARQTGPAGSSPWGSIERLQALSNLFCLAGGESPLLEVLQPAMQEWLHVAAAGAAHGNEVERYLILGALDACISSQTVLAVDTAPNGAVRSLSEGVNLPKDVVKGLMASAWAPDMDVQHAQAAKLAALRVHTSMLLPGAAEPSKASPFAKGTPLARALESEDKVLRAAAAALLPAYVILTPRSQAKVAADAMEALKKLAGSSSEQVKEQAARAILALVQGQALLASQGLQAKPYILLSACREAECCRSEEDVPSPWDLEVTRQPLGSLPRPHMSGLQLLPDLAGLEALAEQLIFQSHGQEHAEAVAVRGVMEWLQLASHEALVGGSQLIHRVLHLSASDSSLVRDVLVQHAGVFARPEVLKEGFQAAVSKPSKDPAHAITSQELALLQEMKVLLEKAENGDNRAGLLQFIAAFSTRMSPRGMDIDVRHILVLVLLVGRLDDPDCMLRCTAAQLLTSKAESMKLSVRELVFGAPRLLEWLGWSITKRPHLLGELASLLDQSEARVVEEMLTHALPPLVEAGNKAALEVLAQKAGVDPATLVHNHCHTIIAKCLYEGADDFDAFVNFVETTVGKGFISLLDSLMQKIIIDILHRASDSSRWAGGYTLPDTVLQTATHALVNLSDIQNRRSAADFLAASDHVTRILKEYGDVLDRYQLAPEKADIGAELRVLRGLLLLIKLTGPYVGQHLPPIMVLLSSSVRQSNAQPLKLQALEGWQALVKALSKEAPHQLADVADQIVVALLEPLQEGGALTVAASKALEELIIRGRSLLQAKLKGLPPLPQSIQALEKVSDILAQERGNLTVEEQVQQLLQSLQHDSASVKATALQELQPYLQSHRSWLSGLWTSSSNSASFESRKEQALQLSQLLGSLLKCCNPEANSINERKGQQACAECLGIVGAVDPARVSLAMQPPAKLTQTQHVLLTTLLTEHLVRILRVASSLQVLDAASVAIQEIFIRYGNAPDTGPSESNTLYAALTPEVQALVRPYFDSRFSLLSTPVPPGPIFGTNRGSTFQRWIYNWPRQLITQHAIGDLVDAFKACNLAFKHDVQTARFLLPYIVQNAVSCGTDAALENVKAEMELVLQRGPATREGELCVQEVFSLLDVLKGWVSEARTAATPSTSELTSTSSRSSRAKLSAAQQGADTPAKRVSGLLDSIDMELLSRAAFQCGAHARALLYFESHVRAKEKGTLNPVALTSTTYEDDDVSFFQEVYGKLEEPDGLSGMVQLRSGGPRLKDQILAAEKAGSWSAALTLYEQALKNEGSVPSAGAGPGRDALKPGSAGHRPMVGHVEGGLSAARRGHLNCLLQLGHLQSLLAGVDGWMTRCADAAKPHLAACGAAAAWRLGQWELLDSYLEQTRLPVHVLDAGDQWEVRLGELLSALHRRDMEAVRGQLSDTAAEVMGRLSAASMESYSRAYPHLVRLHMLQEASDAATLVAKGCMGPIERQRVLRWDERLRITQSSLSTQEPILALRRQLAVLAGEEAEAGMCWLQHAQLCRVSGHNEAAGTASLEALARSVPGAALERARLLWDRDQQHDAILKLKEVIAQTDTGPGGRSSQLSANSKANAAEMVLQLACWTAATGQGVRSDIAGLFEQAVSLDPKAEDGYFAYARYLDQHMRDARERQERVRAARAEAQARAKDGGASNLHYDVNKDDRLGGRSKIILGEDQPFMEILHEVLRNYGKSVLHGHTHIYQSMPRMLTIWFEYGNYCSANPAPSGNKERSARSEVINVMQDLSKRLPMYVWLVALSQLTSRICHPHVETQRITQHILTRVTAQFPHQALWQLAAVSKSTVYARQEAAGSIISSAKRHSDADTGVQRLLQRFPEVLDQFIRLCNHTGGDKRARSFSAKKDFGALMKMMPLEVMMPTTGQLTLTLPAGGAAEKSHNPFGSLISIAGIKDEVVVMPSLQRPKKITLIGSDGKGYTFLAKPKDDLRKDHRMMEVAGVINRLFAREPVSRRRNLYLRRFAVVPLSEDCGFIEWVPQTVTLRTVCQETYAAEGLYDSKITLPTMKKILDTFTGKRKSELLNKWLQMFPPRMHRWQLSKWSEPAAWHAARLAFTRTAAVWSMVGHIVGLGDRHGENMLFDASSGDVVHVDFSCLFDKGLTLEAPEVVPFRLTQNLVDGFGASGVEGVYRKSCEVTLQVLREHRETLVSVMETFLHDPLCEWTKRHRSSEEADNPQAKDALATLEGRLTGTLLGVKSIPCLPLSPEGQAHRLIVEATDKENLGSMYIWWMAWF